MNKNAEYIIKSGLQEMDFERITDMLKDVYWSIGIKKEEVIQGAENSALSVGAFVGKNQIAYARVISDKTRFAYILDVVVDERYRKKGIGRNMILHILDHQELKAVYQWLLITKDAHGVYQKTGFKPLSRPGDWMEIRHERPKR